MSITKPRLCVGTCANLVGRKKETCGAALFELPHRTTHRGLPIVVCEFCDGHWFRGASSAGSHLG